nr:MAG TPA: hypothetical protein [Bacteriophage sp.]
MLISKRRFSFKRIARSTVKVKSKDRNHHV